MRVTANDDRDPPAGRGLVRIVPHRQGRDLEPVRPVDARIAETEGVGRGEPAATGDVLLDAIGRERAAIPDPEPDQGTVRR